MGIRIFANAKGLWVTFAQDIWVVKAEEHCMWPTVT